MLRIKFELITIKFRFFMIFKSCSKSHVLYCSACQLMKLMLFSSLSIMFYGNSQWTNAQCKILIGTDGLKLSSNKINITFKMSYQDVAYNTNMLAALPIAALASLDTLTPSGN